MENQYALIGAGGTGTILLEPLARYLKARHGAEPWSLDVIDGDDFAPENEGRQLFHEEHSGVNKAVAAVVALTRRIPGIGQHVLAIPEYLGTANIATWLKDGTYVLIAVDSYRTRAIIEAHANTLAEVTVINGGNEMTDGSCQIWNRREDANRTPPISFLHPEIDSGGPDRSRLSCAQIALLPGGGQLIIANMMSATWMLAALHTVLDDEYPQWTDLTFDLIAGKASGLNGTPLRGWS